MRLSRRDVSILLSAAAALATARPAAAQSKGRIIYMIPTLLDEFQTEAQKAVESVFSSLGYEVTSLDAQNDASRQLSQIEDMINTKPDAVIMNAVAFDSIVPGIEKARAAGIKVLNFDRLITNTQFELTSLAGTIEIGEIAGNEAVRLLTERHGSPKGKVLQILGDPGDAYTLDIQKGFEAVMAKDAPDVEIITKAALLWEPTNAARAFEDQLLVSSDIDLVFCHAAHLTVPIVSIMEGKDMKPGQIMLMSSNGAPVGLDNIRAGWQEVEVEQPTYAQVYGLAMFIDKIMAGETLEPGSYKVLGLDATLTNEDWGPNLKIPGSAITKDNVDDPRFWGNLQFPSVPVEPVK